MQPHGCVNTHHLGDFLMRVHNKAGQDASHIVSRVVWQVLDPSLQERWKTDRCTMLLHGKRQEKKKVQKVVFGMSFPTSATQGCKVHCANTFFPSREFGQGQPFCCLESVFILYLETDSPNVQGVAFWQWDTSFSAHHSPSEVLRGLSMNDTCRVPFWAHLSICTMDSYALHVERKKYNTLSPLVLYMLESSSRIFHGQSLSHHWECTASVLVLYFGVYRAGLTPRSMMMPTASLQVPHRSRLQAKKARGNWQLVNL